MKKLLIIIVFTLKLAHCLEFQSGPQKTHLIELYTSQSCSSCPPAQKWMNNLINFEGLWKDFIPVAFHVTYWNHLDWKDRFSKPIFTERQKEIHKVKKTGIYTPQVLIDGVDYRQWNIRPPLRLKQDQVILTGVLMAKFIPEMAIAELSFEPVADFGELECYGGFLENGHKTRVLRGENRGQFLMENFVLRELFRTIAIRKDDKFYCQIQMGKNLNVNRGTGIVFWVQKIYCCLDLRSRDYVLIHLL